MTIDRYLKVRERYDLYSALLPELCTSLSKQDPVVTVMTQNEDVAEERSLAADVAALSLMATGLLVLDTLPNSEEFRLLGGLPVALDEMIPLPQNSLSRATSYRRLGPEDLERTIAEVIAGAGGKTTFGGIVLRDPGADKQLTLGEQEQLADFAAACDLPVVATTVSASPPSDDLRVKHLVVGTLTKDQITDAFLTAVENGILSANITRTTLRSIFVGGRERAGIGLIMSTLDFVLLGQAASAPPPPAV